MPHKKSSSNVSTPFPVTRRDFLTGCVGCAAAATCAPALAAPLHRSGAAASAAVLGGASAASEKTRIRLVFTHIPPEEQSWPYQGYDYEARKRELTAKLRERIVGGEEFGKLAREYSEDIGSQQEGGDLGWVNPGQMVPEFEQVMNETGNGETSQPFRSNASRIRPTHRSISEILP